MEQFTLLSDELINPFSLVSDVRDDDFESFLRQRGLVCRRLEVSDAEKSFSLQNSLSDDEKRIVSLRSNMQEMRDFIGGNFVLGIFNQSGDLIAQNTLKTSSKPPIFLNGDLPVKCSNFVELSAVIVREDFRGLKLQSKLARRTTDEFERQHPSAGNNSLFIAGCALDNIASAKSLMRAGFVISEIHQVFLNGREECIEGFTFFKSLNPASHDITIEEEVSLLASCLDEECRGSLKDILQEGFVISRKKDGTFTKQKMNFVERIRSFTSREKLRVLD